VAMGGEMSGTAYRRILFWVVQKLPARSSDTSTQSWETRLDDWGGECSSAEFLYRKISNYYIPY